MKKDEFEAEKFYDNIAEMYHASRVRKEKFFNEFLEVPATLSLLKDVKNKKVLDLGCGTGFYTKILKHHGADVCGVDISPNMIAIAEREIKGVDFRVGSVYALPYKTSHFNIVLAALVIEHLTDLNKAFEEVNRILKKDGTFIFSLHNPVTSATRPECKNRKLELHRVFLNYFDENVQNHHYWSYKEKSRKIRVQVPGRHITYETLIKTIIGNGFAIEDYIDAKPNKLGKKANPEAYALTSKMPYFCIFKVRKR